MSSIFDEIRKAHPEFYANHPLSTLSDEELMTYTQQAGFTDLDSFKMYLCQLRVALTCPLCEQPQNYLSECKGCGKSPFLSKDFLEADGEHVPAQLKTRLTTFLKTYGYADLAWYVPRESYDCMVCVSC